MGVYPMSETLELLREEEAATCAPRLDREMPSLHADDLLQRRYRTWAGVSGKSYIVSAYDARECPAYCDAVVIVVQRIGERRVAMACTDTGMFPEGKMAALSRQYRSFGGRLEFHLHLLAETRSEREAALADLSAALGLVRA